jgi:hypothetical protein
VMPLVSDSGDIEIQPTALYAERVPLARKLAREAGQTGGIRPPNGRGPGFRGHGLKSEQMAECLRLFSNPSPEVLALLERLDEQNAGVSSVAVRAEG